MAAAFCIAEGNASLMGTSRQLLGAAWCHAVPHAYCGSVAAPLESLHDRVRDELQALGVQIKDGPTGTTWSRVVR
jgi:hypothetical protein